MQIILTEEEHNRLLARAKSDAEMVSERNERTEATIKFIYETSQLLTERDRTTELVFQAKAGRVANKYAESMGIDEHAVTRAFGKLRSL